MAWKVRWTQHAQSQVDSAVNHALNTSGAAAAEAVRAKIYESVELLEAFPEIAPVYEKDGTFRTRELICGRYRIFHRLDEAEAIVHIVHVQHSAMREPRLRYPSET